MADETDRHVAPPECPRSPKCRLDPRGCAEPECVEARIIERTTLELHAIVRAAFRKPDDLVTKVAKMLCKDGCFCCENQGQFACYVDDHMDLARQVVEEIKAHGTNS